ncbi:MAG TPA: hypothetical protein VN626_07635 [Clostridia bacterium]|nr:hypothetical protein [Clostridia bacterium]
MGNRAIYIIREKGETSFFYTHYGANALSPLLMMLQAQQLQKMLSESQPVGHVFEHLDYEGRYHWLARADMFCEKIPFAEVAEYNNAYETHGEIEMRMTFDLDRNSFLMEYNPNCPWYRTMGSFSIDLDVGLDNVQKLLDHAEERGITDFGRLLAIYHRSTGLEDKLESARGYMHFEEYLDSPQAQEDRERYWRMFGHQKELDEETAEEMEER